MNAPDRRILPADLRLSSWLAPDGWRHRRFDWAPIAGSGRGSMLFQSGRADFLEKHVEPLSHWHERGWGLSGFDWRGQGGSGRLLDDPNIGHLTDLDMLVDDLGAFFDRWRAETPPPHVLLGHSMGAHLLLRLLAERDVKVDAAVLVAPMLGIRAGPIPAWAARWIARTACRIGRGEQRVWDQNGTAGEQAVQRRLTNCLERRADGLWWKSERPELVLGPPSWAWLAAAYTSMAKLERPGVLEKVATPILLLGTQRDRLVSPAAIRAAAARLPDARLHMETDAAHELLREVDAVRLPVMAAIDDFLDARALPR